MMEFLKQYLGQIVRELEEIKAVCQKMDGGMGEIKEAIVSLEGAVSHQNAVLVRNFDVVYGGNQQKTNAVLNDIEESSVEKEESIPFGCAIAEAVGGNIVLKTVDEQYEQYAVFTIQKGERVSEVDFNPKSVKYAIMYADAQLFPFFDVEYGKGKVSEVNTIEKGKASWENGQWVLKKKPKIRIL